MKEKIKLPQKLLYLCERITPLKDVYGKTKIRLNLLELFIVFGGWEIEKN